MTVRSPYVAIGYWFEKAVKRSADARSLSRDPDYDPLHTERYPHPGDLIRPMPDAVKAQVLGYLRSGRVIVDFMGWSYCRICGKSGPEMGCSEMTDGHWLWPDGLPHYVEVHDVALPADFVARAVASGGVVPQPVEIPALPDLKWETETWIDWAEKFEA